MLCASFYILDATEYKDENKIGLAIQDLMA